MIINIIITSGKKKLDALFDFIIALKFRLFFLLSSAALMNKTYLNGVCGAGPVMILRLTDVDEM